ncbi:6-carboxyhexanoate--CoA ligase [Bordetella genomosp. 5]|uniref:acetate--CoA ligase family protein n=1 Tax=Bordetella genomosp. 5 TaxID=1395608 RepID=UPI000B9DDE5B|nr:acetate--CoA ligase family protein [Bordetella genomosp. 5]OZI38845.1 6-carboxyhexanoate--CoA ligase [Bordetella genomosp. 5]
MSLWQRLMTPRSVAVIGASADPAKTSGRPVRYLLKHGYGGRIYPVNPRVAEIEGLRCYPDIAALPEAPDVALVLLGAERTQQAVRELAARGTGAAIVLASGYAEAGKQGERRQRELREAAGAMRILGPNTIGLVNLTDRITLSASGALDAGELLAGSIGLVSQSGGILGALLSRATARGIGFSRLISTSNEVDLDLADFVDMLADDPATRVIALYVESIRDPAAFRRAAQKAARAGKPVVAFKIGRSESGARAAASHTGALAGADRVYDALFAQAGILRAQTFSDLLDMPAALATGRPLTGSRVAVLTSTGGAGTLLADSLGLAGFELPAPTTDTAAALRALQDGDHAVLDRNPIDVTLAGLQPDLLRRVLRVLLDSPDYDALVVIVGSSGVARPELMAEALRDSIGEGGKPVLAYVSPHAPAAAEVLGRFGIAAFHAPESLGAAMAALRHAHEMAARARDEAPGRPPRALPADLPSGTLDEARSKALFAHYGVPGVRERIVHDAGQARAAAAELGPRVALKLLSARITHKTEMGGVRLGETVDSVGASLDEMRQAVRSQAGFEPDAFLVQEMASGVAELILGVRRDALGTALLIGMGGVVAELVRDTALLLLPEAGAALRAEQVREALHGLKTWPLLDGYRGRPPADVDALVEAVLAFAEMAQALGPRLVEAEINPLFVRARGQGVLAADGVAVLADSDIAS